MWVSSNVSCVIRGHTREGKSRQYCFIDAACFSVNAGADENTIHCYLPMYVEYVLLHTEYLVHINRSIWERSYQRLLCMLFYLTRSAYMVFKSAYTFVHHENRKYYILQRKKKAIIHVHDIYCFHNIYRKTLGKYWEWMCFCVENIL